MLACMLICFLCSFIVIVCPCIHLLGVSKLSIKTINVIYYVYQYLFFLIFSFQRIGSRRILIEYPTHLWLFKIIGNNCNHSLPRKGIYSINCNVCCFLILIIFWIF